MFKMIFTVAMMSVLVLAEAPVLKTGQVQSYDTNGDVVMDSSIKDDGYYKAGVARSYSRSGNIVIDNVTKLQWQDNETVAKLWVTHENTIAGRYDDTSGDTATTYCSDLSLGGYLDWRLPAVGELETLVDSGQNYPYFTENIFQHIISPGGSSNWYFYSSDTSVFDAGSVWVVDFDRGGTYSYSKSIGGLVRCVRGRKLELSSLSRSGEIVTDSTTGLQWQDDTAVKDVVLSWREAIDYCEDLTLGKRSDWRLPSIKELLSIADRSRIGSALNTSVFQNYYLDWYLSSTTCDTFPFNAWYVGFSTGYSNNHGKVFSYLIRCVRGGQLGSPVNPSIIMYLLN